MSVELFATPVDYEDIGERIRRLRRDLGLTQEEMAEKIGISPSFLGHIERGTRVASLETLVAICLVLHTNPEALLRTSLNTFSNALPTTLRGRQREHVLEFLRLAQDTIDGWKREDFDELAEDEEFI